MAVVVPMSNRAELTPDEEISYRHLITYLGDYDKYVVIPESLHINFPGFDTIRFDNSFFGSAEAHSRLLLSSMFYEAFSDYKFILIYHLDALVFSDKLKEWCEKDFDFVGSPWIKVDGAPYSGMPLFEGKVGNGGFSLRKVDSFLKVIYSPVLSVDPSDYWRCNRSSKPILKRYLFLLKSFLKRFIIFNNAKREISRWRDNEESFWVNRGTHYYPDFTIPSVDTALHFGFEYAPDVCFKEIGTLPFGCHAWPKYNRAFWEPYLIQ